MYFWRLPCRLSFRSREEKDRYIQEKDAYIKEKNAHIFGKGWDGASQKGSGMSGGSGGKKRRKKEKEGLSKTKEK